MRRLTLAFLVVSALLFTAAGAAFADMAGAQQPQSKGWMNYSMEGALPQTISADARTLVGDTLDQLQMALGPTSLTSSDGHGGTYYLYQVEAAPARNSETTVAEWYDVDSTGKVVNVVLN